MTRVAIAIDQVHQIMVTYDDALLLRLQAEQTNDPDLYEQAAIAFEMIGMPGAAYRCRERAAYYRED